MVRLWRAMRRADWWHPKWTPIASHNAGGIRFLDLAPKRRGQVATWWQDGDGRSVFAPGFAEWLGDVADELEKGLWTTSPHFSGLVFIDEAEDFEEDES
jgi:cell wall assembly regulator SMI1